MAVGGVEAAKGTAHGKIVKCRAEAPCLQLLLSTGLLAVMARFSPLADEY